MISSEREETGSKLDPQPETRNQISFAELIIATCDAFANHSDGVVSGRWWAGAEEKERNMKKTNKNEFVESEKRLKW